MDLQLAGKKAIVSGASRGIGRAIVEKLVSEGVSVAFFARGAEGVNDLVESLAGQGTVYGDTVDAADYDAVCDWVKRSAEQLGGIDIVISNTSASSSLEFTPEAWRNNFNIDMLSAVALTETAHPYLEQSSAAAILQIATITAFEHHDVPVCPSYGAMKAATINHAAQLAQTWGKQGIRSNSVSPGPIFVEGGAWDGIKEHFFELYERDRLDHPSERLGTAEEVANVSVFVCSPAASWVNGANLVVDGGFTKSVGF
ncbi:SDR family NAD(P)-dependent oxidoreductase [Oceanicoccus sagamiensis]|uniref:Short-chain dehydrogenase n=1 Tax=Oceanicoccus sagamiensis TaxID=716816 RepID=A0A1X9NJN3_9GAMM|nr:SDR family oxidoreductase [Oceanicoccus sagamiensis]ARN75679.1 short-chain dehydrogenase [Oceanicoccus sagamiensis]